MQVNDMKNETKTTTVVIDDHPMMRQGVSRLLELKGNFKVVGEAGNGKDALKVVLEECPDLVLLDLNMEGLNGIQTLELLRENDVESTIVVFTVSDDNDDVLNALKSGADGYLLKDMEPEDLLARLNAAINGQVVLSDKLTHILATALCQGNKPSREPDINNLTKREKEILKQIANGQTNKHIARQLDITEGTVKVHVKHLLKKMKLRTRVEAAVWAVKNDVVH